jgi:hypothetical protein
LKEKLIQLSPMICNIVELGTSSELQLY